MLMIIFSVLGFSACATTTPSSGVSETPVSQSSLKPGECALFGWSRDASRDFVFFASEREVRFDGPAGPVDLDPQGPFPTLDYLDSQGHPVTLKLGEGEVMEGGMRYPLAMIVTLSSQSWERLQPVAIVRTCQSN